MSVFLPLYAQGTTAGVSIVKALMDEILRRKWFFPIMVTTKLWLPTYSGLRVKKHSSRLSRIFITCICIVCIRYYQSFILIDLILQVINPTLVGLIASCFTYAYAWGKPMGDEKVLATEKL